MWFLRADDGFAIGGLSRRCIESLRAVPMLIESNDERVRKRLLPETYDDTDAELQWRRHAAPELERLFLSRVQVIRKDLDAMRQVKAADSWVLLIPQTHCNAWLASLNAARLALYELNDLTPAHMEIGGEALCTEKQREALERIHFLAELQGALMGDFDDPGDDDDDVIGDVPGPTGPPSGGPPSSGPPTTKPPASKPPSSKPPSSKPPSPKPPTGGLDIPPAGPRKRPRRDSEPE